MNIRYGYITEMDASKGLGRVKFDGEDNIVSDWLPISVPGSRDGKFSIPFIVNEHVWCLMDQNLEHGIIGGAIYDAKNQPESGDNNKVRVSFVSGLWVEYDRNDKNLSIGGTGDIDIDINGTGLGKVNIKCNQATIESLTGAELKATTEIKLTAPLVTVSGQLVAGSIGTTTGTGGSGNVAISGDINATGKVEGSEVKEGSIRLGTHRHTGVQTGGGTSGGPTP
jgi:phage baseplate assembly protein V